MTTKIIVKIDTDACLIELRELDDGALELYWTDGPREGIDPVTRAQGLRAIRSELDALLEE